MSPSSDNSEFLAFARRIMRAMSHRVGDADPDDLGEMLAMREVLDGAISEAVQGMRANGFSWAEIAAAAGMTRQSAWEKWRQATPDKDAEAGRQAGPDTESAGSSTEETP